MQVSPKKENDITILVLEGRFDGAGAADFDRVLEKKVPEESTCILDFEKVDYISSAGIRSLVKAAKAAARSGGEVALAALRPQVSDVLDMSGLLILFRVTETVGEAADALGGTMEGKIVRAELAVGSAAYSLVLDGGALSFVDLWLSPTGLGGGKLCQGGLYGLSFDELGVSFGLGGLGLEPSPGLGSLGIFAAVGGLAAVKPADGINETDYLYFQQPERACFHLAAAAGFSGRPAGSLVPKTDCAVRTGDLLLSLAGKLVELAGQSPAATPLGVVFTARCAKEYTGRYFHDPGARGAFVYTGQVIPAGSHVVVVGLYFTGNGLAEAGELLRSLGEPEDPAGPVFIAHALQLPGLEKHLEAAGNAAAPERLVHENLGPPQAVLKVGCGLTLHLDKLWFYRPCAVRRGEEKLTRVELSGDNPDPLPREWEIIARKLYAGDSRLVMEPLKGGFSRARPFRVTAYDRDNRRTLPTVLKLGPREEIRREHAAFKDYVEEYILNNSTTVMGTAFYGEAMGIRYNFVGISGPESRLTWLTHLYREKPAEELLPLFDRIFTDILKPWYGQPRWEAIRLYDRHCPLSLFPDIISDAEKTLGISPEPQEFPCPYLGRNLPNPYHYLKYVYPERRQEERLWYTGINHGDLNMQNILLDERENIYIIDYSETGSMNIVSDFARLEPIFRFETTRLESEEDLAGLLQFEEGLARSNFIFEEPPLAYRGSDPMVLKAHRMICRLRKYAGKTVIFETNLVPYLLAVLQWVYPVVSYRGVAVPVKKLASYSAALIVEQIMRLEKNAP